MTINAPAWQFSSYLMWGQEFVDGILITTQTYNAFNKTYCNPPMLYNLMFLIKEIMLEINFIEKIGTTWRNKHVP